MQDFGFLDRHFRLVTPDRTFSAKPGKASRPAHAEPTKEAPLDDCLRRWQECEAYFVKTCVEARDRSRNPLVATILGLIADDSRKHARILAHLRRSLRTADLMEEAEERQVRMFIDRHLRFEEMAMSGAAAARKAVDVRGGDIERLLIQMLCMDEARHAQLLRALKTQIGRRVRKPRSD